MMDSSIETTYKNNADIKVEFYTVEEISTILKLKPTAVKNLLNKDEIRGAYKLGSHWRIKKQSFDSQFEITKKKECN